MDETESVNLGESHEEKLVKIGTELTLEVRTQLIEFLRQYVDVFAWSYADMPGLDPSVVEHHLPLRPDIKPIRQKLMKLGPKHSLQVKNKLSSS